MSRVLQINTSNLNSLKMHYTALNAFNIDPTDNTLIFENVRLETNEIVLDEIVLMLDQNDFSTFIKNKYYTVSIYNKIIYSLLKKYSSKTSDDEKNKEYQLIDYFIKDFIKRNRFYLEMRKKYQTLFEGNNSPVSIKIFLYETETAKLLIEYSNSVRQQNEIANIIINNYERNSIELTQNNDESSSKNQEKEKELTRVRTNSTFDTFLREEEEYIKEQERFDSAGFTSILAIIAVIIAFGVYIAVLSLG